MNLGIILVAAGKKAGKNVKKDSDWDSFEIL